MTITVTSFLVVKQGNPPEYNDDAAASDSDRGRFAISDGATESGFARLWSRLLVEQFVAHADGPADDWSAWLPLAQQRWRDELHGVAIPYYGEQQFEQGSFATFLGVLLADAKDTSRQWHAVAVGDSCLFHTQGSVLRSFPLEKSSQFDSFPLLVGSRSPVAEIAEKRARSAHGTGQAGDRLWLMSDALSEWCLIEIEAARPPWHELAEFLTPTSSQQQFADWINQLREQRGLHNDDVTLMAIDL